MVGKAWKWRCVWQMETDPHTRVPGTQMALASASRALIPLIQMSSLVETPPVRWHDLPASTAEPGLGLLSLCVGYHHHATFLKQGTSLLSLGCSGLRTLPKLHEEPSLLLSQTPEARWFLAGAWLHKGTSAPPPSPSACSSSDTSCSFLQRCHIAYSTSQPNRSMAKLRFTLLLAGSSSVLDPSYAAPCPNRPSTSFGDARFEVYPGVTGSTDSRSEALSCMNFPIWVLHFIKSVLHSCPGSCWCREEQSPLATASRHGSLAAKQPEANFSSLPWHCWHWCQMAEVPLVLVEIQFSVWGIIVGSPSDSLRHCIPALLFLNGLREY